MKPKEKRNDPKILAGILDKYNVNSSSRLSSLLAAYSELSSQEDEAKSRRDSARLTYEKASETAREAEEQAIAKLAPFIPDVKSGDAVLSALNETEALIDKLTRAQFDMISSQNVYETLAADQDEAEEVDESYLPVPIRNRQDTLAAWSGQRHSSQTPQGHMTWPPAPSAPLATRPL